MKGESPRDRCREKQRAAVLTGGLLLHWLVEGGNVEARKKGNSAGTLIVLLLLGLIALFALAPSLDQIKLRSHAVERHGTDAIAAREGLWNCGEGLHVQLCPKSSLHSAGFSFWCETGNYLCPGMYVTLGGMEKTSFRRPCNEWRECR